MTINKWTNKANSVYRVCYIIIILYGLAAVWFEFPCSPMNELFFLCAGAAVFGSGAFMLLLIAMAILVVAAKISLFLRRSWWKLALNGILVLFCVGDICECIRIILLNVSVLKNVIEIALDVLFILLILGGLRNDCRKQDSRTGDGSPS